MRAFTVRSIDALRPRIEEIVNGLVDTMTERGTPTDLAAVLTWPLPITVICELLGVPSADQDRFTEWVDGLLILDDPERSAHSRGLLGDYLAELIGLRRAEPTDDLLGRAGRRQREGSAQRGGAGQPGNQPALRSTRRPPPTRSATSSTPC